MESKDVLIDAFGRVHDAVHGAVEGLSPDQLTFRIDAEANTIAWLVWHLTRVQDDHVSEVSEVGQVWTAESWVDRLGLPFDRTDTGYGHAPGDVGVVRAVASLRLGYYDAVHARTLEFVSSLKDDDLDRVVDTRWDPPVTLGVRLVSVIEDDLQHAGQAAFVRGIVLRRK
jgi:uncharacterized damage-inducible protein DinB